MPNFKSYITGICEGRAISDIEREKQLSTNIVKVDYLKGLANINFPDDIIDEVEANNHRIEWIEERNKKPSKHGTRPVYIKGTKRFVDDVNVVCSKYVLDAMTTEATHTLSQELQYLFDMFLESDRYSEKVEVNI